MPPIRIRDRLFPSMHSVLRQADSFPSNPTAYYHHIPLPSFVFRYEPYGYAYYGRSYPLMTSIQDGNIDWDEHVNLTVALLMMDEVALDEREPPRGQLTSEVSTVVNLHPPSRPLIFATTLLGSLVIIKFSNDVLRIVGDQNSTRNWRTCNSPKGAIDIVIPTEMRHEETYARLVETPLMLTSLLMHVQRGAASRFQEGEAYAKVKMAMTRTVQRNLPGLFCWE
ncbi:hypothetical protein IW261DRAFT_1413031 [Armillaria novae-zelandiae]|uniref:Uncharacterized protein n=1 Tax=Armillaria novae-zelandiae TaxID=153914 RepID=A0AA39PU01_9AGAR|nr:hypothetical protein IW261DRAFT_1413031 [Armillaria novae-zelandiae]